MITCSAAFLSAVEADSRTFEARFLCDGREVAGDIRTLTIRKGSSGDSEFVPGTVFCPYIEAVIDNCTEALEGCELELMVGIMVGGSLSNPLYDEIRIGYFTVGKPSTSAYRTTFMAQGRIASRLNGYISVLPSVLTVERIAQRIQADTGVPISFENGIDTSVTVGSIFLTRAIYPGLTFRDVLSAITFVVGGYATETANGGIRICRFRSEVTAEYTVDRMLSPPEFHDYNTAITGVKVTVSDGGGTEEGVFYTSGDPVNLENDNVYMTAGAFTQYADNLIGLTYRGGRVSLALGDPRLEAWDTLRITDSAGNVFIMPCMSLVHTYDGGWQTEIIAPSVPEAVRVEGTLSRIVRIATAAEDKAAAAASAVTDMQDRMDSGEFAGEDATTLRIDSSRGVVFKNDMYSTVLSVTIIKGPISIGTINELKNEFGSSAYLQWYFKRPSDDDWQIMSSSDSHLSRDGFEMTVSPSDVDEQIVFQCDLLL